ncbi:dihydroorotase [Vogesella perlucida]|nr:dihydroorotase [Vogesella perlucida]
MKGDILIRNARLVNEGGISEGDVLVRHGRIERIAGAIDADATRHIDAAGDWLLPGMIDDQVHFREPGLTHKGCIATESRAALAGGITSFMDMPNTSPTTTTLDALAHKEWLAAQHSAANYGFHFGAASDNLDLVAALPPERVAGVKVFMGASTGNMLLDEPVLLERLFASVPTVLLAHCEHTPTVEADSARLQAQYGDAATAALHPQARSAEACWRSSRLAVGLARQFGTRLHVLHLTTARELALFDAGPLAGKRITAEACVHHLLFDEADYATLGNRLKCNPSVKSAADRAALLQALQDGRLDVIGTDHAPHTTEEKARPYWQAPSGLPLVQHALPALMALVDDGVLTLPQLVQKTSHNVAELFAIRERGYLREGYWADLALLARGAGPLLPVMSRCGWSPFEQRPLRHHVRATVVSGQLGWYQGQVLPGVQGRALQYQRSGGGR